MESMECTGTKAFFVGGGIASLLGSAAAGLFPRLLPALGSRPAADLTI